MNKLFAMDTPFARFMNLLAGILWVGILWLLCSLPLITLPAASIAAYHTMARVVRKGRGYLTRTFLRQLWSSLRRWLGISLLELVILAWLLFDIIYLYGYGTEFSQTLSYITYGILIVYFGVNAMLIPMASRYAGSRFEIFKLAVYATFRHLLTTIGLLALIGASAYLIYLMPWSILVMPGLSWYLATYLIEPILRRYSRDGDYEEEDEEEDDSEDEEDEEEEYGYDDREEEDEPDEDPDDDDTEEGERTTEEDGEIEVIRLGRLVIRRRKRKPRKKKNENDEEDASTVEPASGQPEEEEPESGSSVSLRDRVVPKRGHME